MIDLKCGDCLELMKDIPDGSIDCIICDLPYGIIKDLPIDGYKSRGEDSTKWDEIIDTNALFDIYETILRMNGIAILFSQEPYTSHIRTFKKENFEFIYPMIWKKDHFANALISSHAPVSYYEDINVFVKRYDRNNNHPLREYFNKILNYIGLPKRQIVEIVGQKVDHCFRIDSMQFSLCSEDSYKSLIDVFKIDDMSGFIPYSDLLEIDNKFKLKFGRTFNLCGKTHLSNVLDFKKDYQKLHPTQKPVELIKCLVRTYTNKGDIVLDNCMGSGTTGVACKELERNFIGIELNEEYFNLAKDRIDSTKVITELW